MHIAMQLPLYLSDGVSQYEAFCWITYLYLIYHNETTVFSVEYEYELKVQVSVSVCVFSRSMHVHMCAHAQPFYPNQ